MLDSLTSTFDASYHPQQVNNATPRPYFVVRPIDDKYVQSMLDVGKCRKVHEKSDMYLYSPVVYTVQRSKQNMYCKMYTDEYTVSI